MGVGGACRPRRRARRWSGLVLACLSAACGSKTGTGPEGALTVFLALHGNSTLTAGAIVSLIAQGQPYLRSVGPGASVTFDVPPGTYDLSVSQIPDHCWAEQEQVSVIVADATPAQATFDVTCIGDFAYSIVDRIEYRGTDGKLTEHVYPGAIDFLSWSPTGRALLVTEWTTPKCDLSLFHVGDGAVTPVGDADFAYDRIGPAWSDTGDRLALLRTRDCTGPEADVALMLYDGTGTTALDSIVGMIPEGMAWRPGTEELAHSDGAHVMLHSWTTGTEATFADLSGPILAWASDGSRLAVQVSGSDGDQIVVLDDQGAELFRLGGSGTGYSAYEPEWAPDGSGLLFLGARPGEKLDIYYVHADGSGARPVTGQEGTDGYPSWPADGDYFLYTSNRAGGVVSVFLGNLLGEQHREVAPLSGSASARFRPGALLGIH